jgi:hypothetical protein
LTRTRFGALVNVFVRPQRLTVIGKPALAVEDVDSLELPQAASTTRPIPQRQAMNNGLVGKVRIWSSPSALAVGQVPGAA